MAAPTPVTKRRPLLTTPDELGPCQRYCEELKGYLRDADRRAAQLQAELATERERWLRLRATAQDADRQGFNIDVVSHMRAIERDVPSIPVLMVEA